jgi:hypothetical protein
MIRDVNNSDLDKALRRLRNRLTKLPATTDRPIARRNARRSVLSAMSLLRAAVDRLYPAIVERKEVVRLKTTKGRLDRIRKAGWRDVPGDPEDIAQYAAAGVRVRRIVIKDPVGPLQPRDYVTRTFWFVPGWAAAIGSDKHRELAEAKRSRTAQRAALAAEALTT